PRRDAASFVEDAVAVVVDRVEAELGPRRNARHHERDALWSLHVRRRDLRGRRRHLRARTARHHEGERDERPGAKSPRFFGRRHYFGMTLAPGVGTAFMFSAFGASGIFSTTGFGFMTSKNALRAISPTG